VLPISFLPLVIAGIVLFILPMRAIRLIPIWATSSCFVTTTEVWWPVYVFVCCIYHKNRCHTYSVDCGVSLSVVAALRNLIDRLSFIGNLSISLCG
jgi:hypothetical protein